MKLEIYWSFRSPYSYLVTDRLVELERDYDVEVDFRPVRPLAMREPDFFERGRAQFLPYLFKDVPREAERQNIPFGLPNPDPIAMDMMSGKVAPEQPLLTMIMGLCFAAIAEGRGLEFAQIMGRAIWGGTPNWPESEILAKTLKDAGFDHGALSTWVSAHQAEIDETLARNEAAQLEHHWGVPLMILDGEPFFGQDRMESLFWRLDQLGRRKA